MKLPSRSVLAATLLFGPALANLSAAPVTGWTAGNGLISNASTNAPTLGNGSANSATTIMYANFPAITLSQIGDQIVLSGSMQVTGSAGNQALGIRFGLFNRNGNTTTPYGWLGYTAMTPTAPGAYMYERNGVNNGVNDFGSSNAAVSSPLAASEQTLEGALGDGTYAFNETISLVATGEVRVAFSVTGTTGGAGYTCAGNIVDVSPMAGHATVFNATGFALAGGYAPDKIVFSGIQASFAHVANLPPPMFFGDTSRLGLSRPFAKDPSVVQFLGKYWMYYSVPPGAGFSGWGLGIAQSTDLLNWVVVGHINENVTYPEESGGMAAPCAKIINNKIHLYYQSYPGNPAKILHAWSTDGLTFTRDPGNPMFAAPANAWSNGRAIDAEVFPFNSRLYLAYASRNAQNYPTGGAAAGTIQLLGVAFTSLQTNSDYPRALWTNYNNTASILQPNASTWEKTCIEAPSVILQSSKLYMFYAGAFNNSPQQIGVATSTDAVTWTRLPALNGQPFLANGAAGHWNSSESGHPGIFQDSNGQTYLFFQGNNDNGNTWHLSKKRLTWDANGPHIDPTFEN